MLVLDTETSVDRRQRLLFGGGAQYRRTKPCSLGRESWQLSEEWIFQGDDLPADELELLEAYCRDCVGQQVPLRLLSRRDFVAGPFYHLAYRAEALVVGFNLPFDLSRLALRWGIARKRATAGRSGPVFPRYQTAQPGATA
jgi:hypothetical protein